LWLDGGHNPLAGAALRQALREMTPERPLYLVAGMLETKDAAGFLGPLADLAAGLCAVPVPGEAAALKPNRLADIARGQGVAATCHDTIEASLSAIGRSAKNAAPRVVICGSLYLAGHVLSLNGAGVQTDD
jgi:dihydrofolate synthase/folylpolyglutamate synthase